MNLTDLTVSSINNNIPGGRYFSGSFQRASGQRDKQEEEKTLMRLFVLVVHSEADTTMGGGTRGHLAAPLALLGGAFIVAALPLSSGSQRKLLLDDGYPENMTSGK